MENPMNLARTTIAAGLAALSLVSASPALAKGGDINNTVISISPSAPAPLTTSGGGGGGRRLTCTAVGIDPVTGSTLVTCTQGGV
jgi:hypothetical protein